METLIYVTAAQHDWETGGKISISEHKEPANTSG